MIFKPKDLTGWSEQEVREFIIAPLIARLGYEKGTTNNVDLGTNLKIKYPRDVLGRMKNTDRPVRGCPDYVMEVDGKKRWVIEAKPADELLDEACVWQAYSYARHGEVRAVCFCLCNGRELQIFRTDNLPEAAHVRTFVYEQFEEEFDTIANILSPDAIRTAWPDPVIDTGIPLGPGLRSFARFVGGKFNYTDTNLPAPILTEIVFTITGGSIERQSGQLVIRVTTQSPFASAQLLSEQQGIDRMQLFSDDSRLSTDQNKPTIFRSTSNFLIPKGSIVLDFRYPQDVHGDSVTVVQSYLHGSKLSGTFEAEMRFNMPGLTPARMRGEFDADLV